MDYSEMKDLYQRLISAHEGLELKGKTMPYTSMNGNMFSFLAKDGALCFRLPAEREAAFNSEYGGGPVEQYGSVMREYVAAPARLAEDPETLARWFAESVAHAATLKPKKTKK